MTVLPDSTSNKIIMKKRKVQRKTPIKQKAQEPERSVFSGKLAAEFAQFVEYHDAGHFSRNLRKMLLEFLMREESIESIYLKDLLYDIDGLFDLLDAIGAEAEGAELE
jgi:hypothetical protein